MLGTPSNKGYEGNEPCYENMLLNRKITHEQQQTKMSNLSSLALKGFRCIKMLEHDRYIIKGKDHYYNPYTNSWGQAVEEKS